MVICLKCYIYLFYFHYVLNYDLRDLRIKYEITPPIIHEKIHINVNIIEKAYNKLKSTYTVEFCSVI